MKMPIPEIIPSEEWCSFAICWPDTVAWRAILRGLLSTPQRGRFWDERTGNVREIQAMGREIFDENIDLRGCIMACDGGTADALREIAASMRACCAADPGTSNGSGGAGATERPETTITEGDSSVDPPPEGFDTWPEFYAYKCAVATWIWETLNNDLSLIGMMNLVVLIASGVVIHFAPYLAAVVATPIPFDDIVAIATLIATVIGMSLSAIDELHSAFVAGREAIICAMYSAKSVSAAKFAFGEAWGAEIDIETPVDEVAHVLKLVAINLANNDAMNKLFERDEEIDYPVADCSFCPGPCEDVLIYGELLDPETGEYASEPAGAYGYHYLQIQLMSESGVFGDECGPICSFDIVSLDGWSGTPIEDFDVYNNAGDQIWTGELWWPDGTLGRRFRIRSLTAFTGIFERGACDA